MNEIGQTPRTRYDEGCLGAHALNFIGDRWALLVVRELMFAPKRFQMIRAGMPGITASVLTQRLGQLTQTAIIAHDPVLGIYTLTDLGRALHPLLTELCRWALLLPGHDPRKFISISALMISISATVDRARAAGSPLRAGFLSGTEGFEVVLSANGLPQVRAVRAPDADFVLEGSGNALAAAVYGPPPTALAAAGRIALHGDPVAAQEFTSFFSVTPQTRSSSDSPEEIVQAPAASST
ncbi:MULTISPECIES: winged helix-turn-helix transcriptional regulator [Paracoccus]|uniref:Transcriptional regulator n=1 Tax=Paracoccus litorisediminis TaxID=2006130 RepID=A0A844HG08_9RHOB|nr:MULTISPECIES: winged helix-turn-helix transcriptional regulator [Paracoccus]MBD9526126.1 winged helix-turn-helix transcriptional regulator [Paracoccus sp. PAR01]MTH58576.1 transcriptional regulator [Paracoccus litorisediminis]